MLTSLRSAAGTWVAKLLLVLLVLSFAVWGISGQILGGSGTNVISAGNTNVSVVDYRLAYDRQVATLSQQFGTRLTREQARALGIDDQVVQQLVAGAVLDEQAREMKLGLSRDRLALLTAEDPAFRGAGGRFDRQQFEFVLRQVGMTPDDYLRNREQVAVRQQIVEAVSDDIKVPDAFLRAMALYRGEDRTVEYVAVPRSAIGEPVLPTDAQLTEYFEANTARYAAPEYRKLSYIVLDPETIADEAAISDESVAQYYESNRARYTQDERRTIEQLVFASEEAAQAATQKIAEMMSFEDLVASEGKSMADVQLGTFTKEDVADPAIAEAAFNLMQGEVSDVVRGSFGYLLLRVPEITPAEVRPLEEVSAEIRRELAVEEATRSVYDVHDNYEDARASGESMGEAASRLGLTVRTIDAIDSQGRGPDGQPIAELPEQQQLLTQAFETEAGIENASINLGAVGFLYYEVDEITPARDRTLEEIRDRVVLDWTEQDAAARLAELAAQIKAELDGGKPFAELASERGLELQTRRGLRRDADGGDLGRAGVAAIFGQQLNGTGVTPAEGSDAQIVFKVTEVFEPADADPSSIPAETVDGMSSGLADDLLDQLVARLRSNYGVTVNQSAINQALSF